MYSCTFTCYGIRPSARLHFLVISSYMFWSLALIGCIKRYRVASSCMTEVHLDIKKAGVLCAYLFILNIFYLLK